MSATLTDRYIAATVRSLPPETQDDVRGELAASIADAVETRVEQGETPEQAERAVLTGLGDPGVLAAGYADRPLHLIGPRYFLTWWRLLKLLLWIVPVCAVVGVTIGNLIQDAPIGQIIGNVFAVGIGAIVHIAFWTTLVFALLDRAGADAVPEWDVDSLPEPEETGAGRGELISSLVFLGLAAAVLLWDRFVGVVFFADGGTVDVGVGLGSQTTALSLLNPDLWPWWTGALLVVMAAEAALAIAVFARRGWTRALAAFNTVLAVLVAAGAVVLLATDRVLNPAFSAHMIGLGVPEEVGRIVAILTGAVFIGVAAWDVADGWRKARRS